MEKKNVSFTKDGMKVGVKEVKNDEYADRTQKYVSTLFHRWAGPPFSLSSERQS
jgi:hypothetical protein